MLVAAAWWPPSPTPMATSWGCFRTDECRPRSRAQRRRDTEHRLTHGIGVWVAGASADGAPYPVPLSFDWEDEALLVATPTDSPTGRNLAAPGPLGWGWATP